MTKFPLPAELDALHDSAILYASAVQNQIAQRGGAKTIAAEALNALSYIGILSHRSVRTLCEEGWTPVTASLNRTLLDVFGNCVAICKTPADSEYMGFKYLTHFYRKWLVSPGVTAPEQAEATNAINLFKSHLSAADQAKAQALLAEPKPKIYWFQSEFDNIKDVLSNAQTPIYQLFSFFSGPTHGGFDMKILFNDDVTSEDIEPREHPNNRPKAIVASSRLLAETCHIRDHWENSGANENLYKEAMDKIQNLKP